MVSLIALVMLLQSAPPVVRDGVPLQFQHASQQTIQRCLSRSAPSQYDVNLLCRVTADARLADCEAANDRSYPRSERVLALCLARGMRVVTPTPFVGEVVPVHLFGRAR